MVGTPPAARARAYLTKARECLASADQNVAARRFAKAGSEAIRAGVLAKNATVMRLEGRVRYRGSGPAAARELGDALAGRTAAGDAVHAIRELAELGGAGWAAPARARQIARRARTLVEVAEGLLPLTGLTPGPPQLTVAGSLPADAARPGHLPLDDWIAQTARPPDTLDDFDFGPDKRR
ncbi:MAG: hypothetical protein LBL01_01400 [Bifidobacteriaceae bacterium]|jgi:hypothetical protein|nr:hypothetical protein [Bifidobacteriaceae bacterium]